MRKTFIAIAIALTALSLGACVTIKDAPAGAYGVGNGYAVNLGRQWSDITAAMNVRGAKVKVLSIDGPLLNSFWLTDGLAAGDYLMRPVDREHPTPKYRIDMAPTELIEFVTDNVAAMGYQRVESSNPRRGRFADGDAIRVDLKCTSMSGLEISGTALIAERRGRLYIMLYLAPTEHYFNASLAEVEKVMNSVTVQ